MIEVGFWCNPNNIQDTRQDPRTLQDPIWFKQNEDLVKMIIDYLEHGYIESYEMGYSFCRFQCNDIESPKELGACNMTDGIYLWPEGYLHYIRKHFVRPPDKFVEQIQSCYSRESSRWSNIAFERLMWSEESHSPIPIPKEMQKLIHKYTTLN